MSSFPKRRVVVTGVGALTPLGKDANSTWAALLNGVNGIQPFASPRGVGEFVATYGGIVADHELPALLSLKEARHMPPYIQYALSAASEAMMDSALAESNPDWTRCGVMLGSVCGGAEVTTGALEMILKKGPRAVSPRFVMNAPINMAAGEISVRLGLKGPQLCISTHGTTGTHAIGRAARIIQYGDADVMLAGATDAPLTKTILSAFASDRVLSREPDAQRASRPFGLDRSGIVLSEGAAMLVLEEREHALRRGADIYAELVGYGANADALDPVVPDRTGQGIRRAIQYALNDASLPVTDVHYISANGDSSQHGDVAEANAITAVFGLPKKSPEIRAVKSQFGHCMGAAGAVEALTTVLAVRDQVVPPTLNQETPDPTCPVVIHSEKKGFEINNAIGIASGYGVNNAVLVWQICK